VHSVLGEKYLIIRLNRRDNLPKLLGSDDFTKRLIRFAWHLTTLAWWAIAAIVWLIAQPSANLGNDILWVVCITFVISGITSLYFSHGKHLSWLFFFAIAATSYMGMS
jgi:hypothetical protein